jgi:hypothetical protein
MPTKTTNRPFFGIKAIQKLLRWVVFGVGIALMPFILKVLSLGIIGNLKNLSFQALLNELISHGDLLLVSVALGGAALGELFGSGPKREIYKILAGGGLFLILLLEVGFFGHVSVAYPSCPLKSSIDADFISSISLQLFLGTVITSVACIILSED